MAKCGTTTGYSQGCRCDDCKTARREYVARHRAANIDRLRQEERERGVRDADRHREYQRKRRAEDPERVKQIKRESYARHAERIRQERREQYAADPELRRASATRWRNANLEKANRLARERRRQSGKGSAYANAYRARVLEAFVEEVDPLVVFERDEYVCRECRKQCQRTAWPARDYATVDHIVALTNGGEHSYANTQTLCFSCNAAKGNRR